MKNDESMRVRARLTTISQAATDCLLTLDGIETEDGSEKKLTNLEHAKVLQLVREIDDSIGTVVEILTEIDDGYYDED